MAEQADRINDQDNHNEEVIDVDKELENEVEDVTDEDETKDLKEDDTDKSDDAA